MNEAGISEKVKGREPGETWGCLCEGVGCGGYCTGAEDQRNMEINFCQRLRRLIAGMKLASQGDL